MPTTPPTAQQVCVDPNLAAGEASPEVRRPVHASKPAPKTQPKSEPQADWWGDAWGLWNRHPQGEPQAGGAPADNLSLNSH
jgi:hypothetical protein